MKRYKFRAEDWHTLSDFLIEFASSSIDEIYSFAAKAVVRACRELECEIETDANPLLIRRMLGNHCSNLAAESLKSSEFFDGVRDDVFGNQMKANDLPRGKRF